MKRLVTERALRRLAERYVAPERANFWSHVVDGGFYGLGEAMVGGAEVFPLLAVTRLGASNTTLGLINALLALSILAMIVAAPRVEAVREKRRLLVGIGVLTRVPHLLVAAALLLLGPRSPGLCLAVITALLFFKGAAASLQGPPWADLVAETIPPSRTGLLFGLRAFLSSGLGLFAGFASAAILASLAFPASYAVLYAAAFCLVMVSWVAFTQVDEVPEHVTPPERRPARHYFADLLGALRADRSYRNLLFYRALRNVGLAAGPFYAVAAAVYHGMDEAAVVGSLIVARRLAGLIGPLAGPLMAHRISHKRVMQMGAVLGCAGGLMAALAPAGARALYVAAVFVGALAVALVAPSHMALTLRIYPRGRRVGYGALSGLALTPVALVAAPAAGLVMDRMGQASLFALAAAASIASLLPLGRCSEPPQEAEGTAPVDGVD